MSVIDLLCGFRRSSEMRFGVALLLTALGPFAAWAADGGPSTAAAERLAIKPAATDPFRMPAVAPAPMPAPAYVPPADSHVQMTPSFQLSFLGRLQTADGRTLVMAQSGDGRTFTLEEGKVLSNGYRVERLGTSVVELLHPQTQSVVSLPLPPIPRLETR